ncbi:MAG: [protein-PII] uridylyltransferase [Alphaproteobacteria bacterium]|nr:[protein-PII] uridylyltransferase [Alphaproteobacteria bacterium]
MPDDFVTKTRKTPSVITVTLQEELAAGLRAIGADEDASDADRNRRLVELLKEARTRTLASLEQALSDGAGGLQAVQALSACQDNIISALYEYALRWVSRANNPTSGERLCVAAVGGYGRGGLAPQSDIDLLFLLPYKQTPWGESVVEFMLYVLWDLGLKVGHATRSVDECIRLSKGDTTIRTALLESRYLCGDQELFSDLKKRYTADVAADTSSNFVDAKLTERDQRHMRQGETRYLVEPNVKDGKGGLRDLHTLYWIGKYIYGVEDARDLIAKGVLTQAEYDSFQHAEDFLSLARCHLHLVTGRPVERLSFDVQQTIADRLGYVNHDGLTSVEWFMKDYFRAAKEVGDLTRIFCALLEDIHRKPVGLRRFLPRFGRSRRKLFDAFRAEGGRLNVANDAVFIHDPANLLRLFHTAQHNDLDIHPKALRLVTRSLHLINDALRADNEANRLFLEMLCSKKDPETTLRRLNEAGVFGLFVPDFGRVVAMMQFNMYHHYTVDEHLIRAIGILSQIEAGTLKDDHPLASEIMRRIKKREVIYLGVLLHDIAKGRPDDHSQAGANVARELCPRLGLSESDTELVIWLVENHLLMSDVAQKRDISDPRTITKFVEEIKSQERLRLMLVLTVVDIRAVGPGVWNSWKGQLLRQLNEEAESLLSGGHSIAGRGERIAAAKTRLAERLQDFDTGQRESILAMHYPPYWLAGDTDLHEKHARFVTAARLKGGAFHLKHEVDLARGVTEITLYAPDHAGLFARVAGAFASIGANIVDAKIFTTSDGMALDMFLVQDMDGGALSEEKKLKRLSEILHKTLDGRHHPHIVLAGKQKLPKREQAFTVRSQVMFDNEASNTTTMIEVTARDRPGLLHDLTWALFENGVSINSAHVTTFGEEAIDTFYVRDAFGLKITSAEKLKRIEGVIMDALEGKSANRLKIPTSVESA